MPMQYSIDWSRTDPVDSKRMTLDVQVNSMRCNSQMTSLWLLLELQLPLVPLYMTLCGVQNSSETGYSESFSSFLHYQGRKTGVPDFFGLLTYARINISKGWVTNGC